MVSQKEFMIGCLIGSAIGAVAVAVSTKYGDKIDGFHLNHKKKIRSQEPPQTLASKLPTEKKIHTKKPVKNKSQ